VYYAGLYALRASFGLDRVDIEVSREEKLASGKADMELCEIKNGRLAMIAITVRNTATAPHSPMMWGTCVLTARVCLSMLLLMRACACRATRGRSSCWARPSSSRRPSSSATPSCKQQTHAALLVTGFCTEW